MQCGCSRSDRIEETTEKQLSQGATSPGFIAISSAISLRRKRPDGHENRASTDVEQLRQNLLEPFSESGLGGFRVFQQLVEAGYTGRICDEVLEKS